MESIFEANNRGTFCVGASDLDGVFDGFGAGIEKNGFLREIARGKRVKFFRDGNVAFIWRDGEAKVQILFELLADRGDDARRAVTDV